MQEKKGETRGESNADSEQFSYRPRCTLRAGEGGNCISLHILLQSGDAELRKLTRELSTFICLIQHSVLIRLLSTS